MRKMHRSLLKNTAEEEVQINVTPLIDVVFVVLIMFILIAPMMELDRIQLASAGPTKETSVSPDNSAIAIHVHADNTIWMHKHRIDENQLLEILKAAQRAHPDKIPQLFHDKKAAFGTYQNIKNALETAGFEQLDIILQP